jgi:peroxiredoxin
MAQVHRHPSRRSNWLRVLMALAWLGLGLPAVAAANPAASPPAQLPRLEAGMPAPALRLPDLDGRVHELQEWRGQVLLINFWASWCGPCVEEIPDLLQLQARHGQQGLQVIGVGMDEAYALRRLQQALGISYPLLVLDPERGGPVAAEWGNAKRFLPYTIILDRQGRVAAMIFGVLASEVIDTQLLPLLGTPEAGPAGPPRPAP